MTEKICFQIIW